VGVGANLHDHLQIRTIFKVKNTVTLNRRAATRFGQAAMALEYALFRTGPLTMPPSQLGAFARSDPSQAAANLEWHVQPLSLDKFGEPLHAFDAVTPSVCNLQPTSRGHVRIKSPDPAAHPAIRPNYLATAEDLAVAVAGVRFTRRIMAAKALARFEPEESKPGPELASDDDLKRAAGALGTTIFHPVGTCRMGLDALAVVDDRLRVHGISGLRVIDASVIPRITSGKPNAPTVMIMGRAPSPAQRGLAEQLVELLRRQLVEHGQLSVISSHGARRHEDVRDRQRRERGVDRAHRQQRREPRAIRPARGRRSRRRTRRIAVRLLHAIRGYAIAAARPTSTARHERGAGERRAELRRHGEQCLRCAAASSWRFVRDRAAETAARDAPRCRCRPEAAARRRSAGRAPAGTPGTAASP
jgi:hypothetical protein